jgi:hypothetical protein
MGAILANRSFRSAILFSLGLCLCVVAARAQTRTQANFAQRPYMGWSSWSRFHDQIDESLIKGQADALIASRLPAAGYRYINMDDGWSNGFDDQGIPMANPATFPTGIKALSTYCTSVACFSAFTSTLAFRRSFTSRIRALPAPPAT